MTKKPTDKVQKETRTTIASQTNKRNDVVHDSLARFSAGNFEEKKSVTVMSRVPIPVPIDGKK